MSEQIREQVSAFLDGELPGAEAELLLKRLTRDVELRESFGRYALIGESMRGGGHARASRTFAARVNLAIDGVPAGVPAPARTRAPHWWRPFAGAAVAAGVATVAVVSFHQRTADPAAPAAAPTLIVRNAVPAGPTEAISYTVPASVQGATGAGMPAARLTNYVFAHSKYSSALGQRDVLTDLLVGDEDADAATDAGASSTGGGDVGQRQRAEAQDARVSP